MTRRRETSPRLPPDEGDSGRLNRIVLGLAVLGVVVGFMLSLLLPHVSAVSLAALVAVAFAVLVMLAAKAVRQPLSSVAYFFIILALSSAVFALLTRQEQPLRSPTPIVGPTQPLMTEVVRPTHTPAPPSATRTATATRTPTATPTPIPPGGSRANPLALGQTLDVAGWQAVVLAVERGEPAWQRIKAANQFNKPAPEGQEYVLATVRVTYGGDETAAQAVSSWHWYLTGDRYIRYAPAGVVSPHKLDAQVFKGGQVEGVIAFHAGKDEASLILVYAPRGVAARDMRYVAAEPGATLSPPPDLASIQPDEQGTLRALPAPVGRTVTAYGWQAAVLESQRGDQAWQTIHAANSAAKPPDAGQEYVLARVWVRYVNAAAGDNVGLTSGLFRLTGDKNVVYNAPAVPAPAPTPASFLYAGGETEGWVVGQATAGEGRLMLVFQPPIMSDMGRFLALER